MQGEPSTNPVREFNSHWSRRVFAGFVGFIVMIPAIAIASSGQWVQFFGFMVPLAIVLWPVVGSRITIGPQGIVSRRWWSRRVDWADVLDITVSMRPNPDEDDSEELYGSARLASAVSGELLRASGRLRATVTVHRQSGGAVKIPLHGFGNGHEIIRALIGADPSINA
jgi:hypothetical protein